MESFHFNLFVGNSLEFDWKIINVVNDNGGFDIIVGNPPYVGSSKIDKESKALLKNWSVSKSGKADLYIPFFEIALENLNLTGILGFITVNTFYKSLNGRSIREYFSKNGYELSIVDFAGEQLFKKRSTYTCICIVDKFAASGIKYIKTESKKITCIKEDEYIRFHYNELNNYNGWYLINEQKNSDIIKIENTGTPLGKLFEIRNGFATLKNNVYVFKPTNVDSKYFYLIRTLSSSKSRKEFVGKRSNRIR